MKKMIIIIVLAGMFGWAVYDLAADNNESQLAEKEDNSDNAGASEEQPPFEQSFDEQTAIKDNESSIGLQVGDQAPDFQLETLDGKTVKLSDYRGKRVMVNFWATWCPPCRAEMPDMVKFYEEKDVEILAVNLTQTESGISEVKNFVEEFGITFLVLLDKEIKVATKYAIRPIPTSYMIDSRGIIRHKALGAMNYEMMVNEFEKMK